MCLCCVWWVCIHTEVKDRQSDKDGEAEMRQGQRQRQTEEGSTGKVLPLQLCLLWCPTRKKCMSVNMNHHWYWLCLVLVVKPSNNTKIYLFSLFVEPWGTTTRIVYKGSNRKSNRNSAINNLDSDSEGDHLNSEVNLCNTSQSIMQNTNAEYAM